MKNKTKNEHERENPQRKIKLHKAGNQVNLEI